MVSLDVLLDLPDFKITLPAGMVAFSEKIPDSLKLRITPSINSIISISKGGVIKNYFLRVVEIIGSEQNARLLCIVVW